MAKTPSQLIEIATRSQVFIERYKGGVVKEYEPFLVEMAKLIRKKLEGKDLTQFSRGRLNKLLKVIAKDLMILQGTYLDEDFYPSSFTLAKQQAKFEVKSLQQVVKYDFVTPSETQLTSAVLTNPMSAEGYAGKLLDPFIKDISKNEVAKITNLIRQGVYEGLTTPQIVNNIIGTKKNKFTDGQLVKTNRNMSNMVRTAVQHVSSQARQETWNRNNDIIKGVTWVSTLDSRTSTICRSLDQQEFPLNKGPRPPIHIGCRSTTAALLSEQFAFLRKGATRKARNPETGKVEEIPAKTSYYDWLKGQSSSFQDSELGKTRGKLLRDGKLSSQRFAELQLGRNFRPLTTITRNGKKITPLEQMEEMEPLAFERAGISSE